MKTRIGFVANSSSSSFILVLPQVPESVEDLHAILFPGGERTLAHPYWYDDVYSSRQVAETVWSDIQGGPATKERFQEECQCGSLEGDPQFDYRVYGRSNPDQYRKAWDAHERKVEEYRKAWAAAFRKKHAGKVFFIVEYKDEGAFGCFMEHGDVFRNIDHQRISKH